MAQLALFCRARLGESRTRDEPAVAEGIAHDPVTTVGVVGGGPLQRGARVEGVAEGVVDVGDLDVECDRGGLGGVRGGDVAGGAHCLGQVHGARAELELGVADTSVGHQDRFADVAGTQHLDIPVDGTWRVGDGQVGAEAARRGPSDTRR